MTLSWGRENIAPHKQTISGDACRAIAVFILIFGEMTKLH